MDNYVRSKLHILEALCLITKKANNPPLCNRLLGGGREDLEAIISKGDQTVPRINYHLNHTPIVYSKIFATNAPTETLLRSHSITVKRSHL